MRLARAREDVSPRSTTARTHPPPPPSAPRAARALASSSSSPSREVDGEIAELQRKLADKQAERDKLQGELDAADAKIATVRAKFDRQLQRLEQRQVGSFGPHPHRRRDSALCLIDHRAWPRAGRGGEGRGRGGGVARRGGGRGAAAS